MDDRDSCAHPYVLRLLPRSGKYASPMSPVKWRKQVAKKTLSEVATSLGCSSLSSVQRYETGEREAPNSVVLAYAKISDGQVTGEDLDLVRKRFLRHGSSKSSTA